MPADTALLPPVAQPYATPRLTWRPAAAEAVQERATFTDCFYAFLFGLGTRLQVRLIGYLPFSEIAILLLFPLCFPAIQKSGALRRTGWCIPLLFVWLVSLLTADLTRQTDWSLSARGIARIVILLTAIPFLTWFFRRCCYEKIFWWLVGVVPSFILSAYIFRGGVHEGRELVYGQAEMTFETHWGAVYSMPLLIFGLWVYQRNHLICYAVSVALGFYNIANGARSTGALTIIGPALTAAVNTLRGRKPQFAAPQAGGRIAIWKLAAVALVGGAVLFGVLEWYKSAAASGQLGERARSKYLSQSRNRFGLLMGGRPEFFAGLLAISKSPILGYGSWPLDHDRFFEEACDIMQVRLAGDYYSKGYPLIPSHSHILQAWVESGVFATLFWVYVLAVFVRAIYLPIKDEKRLRGYVTAGAFSFIWPIFFSPISNRIELACMLAVVFNQVLFSRNSVWPAIPREAPQQR